MADKPTPTPEQLAREILSGGPVVAETSKALGKFLSATFDALSADVDAVIQKNQTPAAVAAAINALTADMIKLLRRRVGAALDASGKPARKGPDAPS